jgi:ABC-2 type transport system ATP-binding protein
MEALVVRHLTKRFGSPKNGYTAVNDVSFSVAPGEIYSLIGQNGAGKTTLLKMLVGLLIPTSGSASVYGHDITVSPVSAKRQIGYISDDPSAYEYLSGREFLTLTGRLREMKPRAILSRIDELVSVFPIEEIFDQPMSRYSRGNKQKVAVLAAVFAKPKLLIIDEPIVGMDARSIGIMGNLLSDYAKDGNAVVLVTHILDFAQKYADRAGIIREGVLTREVPVTKTTVLEKFL